MRVCEYWLTAYLQASPRLQVFLACNNTHWFSMSWHPSGDLNTHVTIHPCRLCARPVAGLMIGWQSEVKELDWPIKHDGGAGGSSIKPFWAFTVLQSHKWEYQRIFRRATNLRWVNMEQPWLLIENRLKRDREEERELHEKTELQ